MKATFILTSLILLSYILIYLLDYFSLFSFENIVKNFGFSFNNFFKRPYVLITSIFIHGSIDHLISNLIALIFFGIAVEDEIGAKKMLLIFFYGAFFGDIFSLFFYSPETISIGASAGIFALVGFGMIIRPLDISLYPPFYIIPLGLVGILYTIYNIIGFIFNIGNISYIGHFAGLFAGLFAASRHRKWKKGIKMLSFLIFFTIFLWILLMIFKFYFYK